MSATANRIVKNTGYLYARMSLTLFISLWTTRLVLNALGANDFGVFTVVGGAISMLGFLNSSMATATQRFISFYQGVGDMKKCNEVFHTSVILHFAISIVLIISLLLAGWLFFNFIFNIPKDRFFAAYVIYGSLVVSTAFSVMTVPYDATLNAHENMRYYAAMGVLESFLKLMVAFIVVYVMTDKLVVYGVLMACIPILLLIVMRVYCYKNYEECRISMRRGIDKGLLKEMIGFAGWNFITSFSSIFTQYGLGIVLNYFYGALLNAAQGIANQLSGMLMAFSNSMLKAVNPVITKSEGHGDRMKALQYAMKGSKFSFVFLSFFAIPFITEMNSILVIWLNKVPEWAVLFCSLQLLRTLIEQLTVGLLSMLKAYGDIKLLSIMRGMLNIMPMIATVLAFVNGCAPYWMYIFWIFFWSLGGCMVILFLSKKLLGLHLKVYLNEVILPCLAIAIIPFIVIIFIHMIQISSMMKMCLILLLYMFSFFLLLRLLVLSKDERLFLYNRFCNIRASINESIH